VLGSDVSSSAFAAGGVGSVQWLLSRLLQTVTLHAICAAGFVSGEGR